MLLAVKTRVKFVDCDWSGEYPSPLSHVDFRTEGCKLVICGRTHGRSRINLGNAKSARASRALPVSSRIPQAKIFIEDGKLAIEIVGFKGAIMSRY